VKTSQKSGPNYTERRKVSKFLICEGYIKNLREGNKKLEEDKKKGLRYDESGMEGPQAKETAH
jgi:hypothetical protein